MLVTVFFGYSHFAEAGSCPLDNGFSGCNPSTPYYCTGSCRAASLVPQCPTFDSGIYPCDSDAPGCGVGCASADGCGICASCSPSTSYLLCSQSGGAGRNCAPKGTTQGSQVSSNCTSCTYTYSGGNYTYTCTACPAGYSRNGSQCVLASLMLGPFSVSGSSVVQGTSANSTMFINDVLVSIGTGSTTAGLYVAGASSLADDLSMVHNKSIKLNNADSNTVLLIGNYGDSMGFGYGASTTRTASLAVEGDVKANRLCIKEDCRAEWSDIQGTSYWTASSTYIYNNNSGNVGIGDNEPYNKLSVNGNIVGSGSLAITGTATSSNYFISNLGVGGLPNGFWNKFVDLSGSGNSAYIVKTGSINAVVAVSDSGTPAGTGYNFTHSGQQMVLGTLTNQPLNFITNGTSKIFLDTAGNLGIGTTTPGEKLSVQGNIALPMTSASEGMVKLAGQRYLHSFGNTNNLFVGYQAGNTSLTTAVENTFIGSQAGQNLTTGSYNVAIGRGAGARLTSGAMNTLIGRQTGGNITTGGANTLVGLGAGEAWTGSSAVVMGYYAGRWNSLGTGNVIIGASANYSGNSNSQTVAIGNSALNSLVNGSNNTALGNEADYYAPSAGASSLTAGTNLGIGMYYYRVTYVLSTGETNSAGLTTIVTTSGNQAVNLSSIPVYSGPLVCSARKIYRTKVGAYGNGPYYLVATINDNSTTTYTDTTPDASLVTVLSDNANSVMIGYGAKALKSNQLILGSNQSEIYLGKGVYSANPGTISLLATGGMGTNNVGANLVIAGGQGTGSAAGGNITFQTAAAGSSGSLFNSLIDRVTITNNGNVGIGTTSPLAKLDVDGSLSVRGSVAFSGPLYINGGSRLLMVDNAGNVSATTTQAGVSMPAGTNGQTLRYGTSAWEATSTIFVKDGGNVGIGTTNPTAKLQVISSGGANTGINLTLSNASSYAPIDFYTPSGLAGQFVTTGANFYNGLYGGDQVWLTSRMPNGATGLAASGANGYIKFATGGEASTNERMRITSSGNVGIGTTSPLAKLDVDGSLSVRGSVAFSGPLYINGGSRLLMVDNAGNVSATTTQAGVSMPAGTNGQTLRYGTSAWEATSTIFVKDGGNVGIGTTSPGYVLDVNGGARFTGTVKVAAPIDASDAVTKSYLDSALINSTSSNAYVLKAGDSMSGNLDMTGHNIVGINKLTVTTIDPLYDIDGIKYSTYAPSIVGGVKEEYVGRGEIRQCGMDYCSWRLDFSNQEKGSDLWVWRRIVDFQPDKIDVLMTAYGQPASLSYEIEDNQIIFYADRPTKFSYRLVGARFDWRQWPTLASDQSETTTLIIR